MSLTGLLLASLLLSDPSGDAHGAGDLVPPTAAVYSSTAPFDLVEVEVVEAATLTLRVRLAERPNPGDLANGITLPVIDLYVDTEEGGREELLPGPGLRAPPEQGWEIAIRVTGDAAYARRAADGSDVDHAVTVTPDGDALRIATPFETPERTPRVHALTGVYDAFDADAWRPLTRAPSPWAFSSESARFPVVDVLAEDDAAQQATLTGGVLPLGRRAEPAAPWLVLMVLGLVIALAGLLLRSRVGGAEATADAPVARDAEALEEDAEARPEAPDAPDVDVATRRVHGPRAEARPRHDRSGRARAGDAATDGERVYDVDPDLAAPLLWNDERTGEGRPAADAEDAVAADASAGDGAGTADDVRPSRAASPSEPEPTDGVGARRTTQDDAGPGDAGADDHDEAMLGPRTSGGADATHDASMSEASSDAAGTSDEAEDRAVLRESDLFDPDGPR